MVTVTTWTAPKRSKTSSLWPEYDTSSYIVKMFGRLIQVGVGYDDPYKFTDRVNVTEVYVVR